MTRRLIFEMILALCVAPCIGATQSLSSSPPDSIVTEQPDRLLEELEVTANPRISTLRHEGGTGYHVGSKAVARHTAAFGTPDPIRLMQSLPAVSSNDALAGGLYVQGCESAHNHTTLDGISVYNPYHIAGIFSVFNTPHFESFSIVPDSRGATDPNFIGALITGDTPRNLPQKTYGEASVGIIESHATVGVPLLKDKSALILSGRITYIDLLFRNAIKMDNSPMRFGFNDWNATYTQELPKDWHLKLSAFMSSDYLKTSNPEYLSSIDFRWRNLGAAARFLRGDIQSHTLSYSHYSNQADFVYSDVAVSLPSSISDLGYTGGAKIGAFAIGAGINLRRVTPQTSRENKAAGVNSLETYAGIDWNCKVTSAISLKPGLKMALFATSGYNVFLPLPMLELAWRPATAINVTASAGRYAQFTHKVLESNTGFPTDFWITATSGHPAQTGWGYSLSLSGSIAAGALHYSLSAYYRDIDNMVDFTGCIFDLLDNKYNPMDDVLTGRCRAYGFAVMIKKNFGVFDGWVRYNYGHSRQRFDSKERGWYPSPNDRTHDVSINLAWSILDNLNVSANWVYATGRPFTEPLYGYIIGENLICEYKPHNSSRLPDWHRLDVAANWTFRDHGRVRQGITVSIFNVYGHENVMFQSFKYSPENGLHRQNWSMKMILPAVCYYIKF